MSAEPLWKKNSLKEESYFPLLQQLNQGSKKRVEVKINDNRTTMLSVRWEPRCTKVSLHRMFLKAPKNIMDELACYVRKEHRSISVNVRAFIENHLKDFDYSHELDLTKLQRKGKVYDLQKIYDEINATYFGNRLKLNITWYGNRETKGRNNVTFGLYQESLRLIKIHRRLDQSLFPPYLVAFVVYHEMLHHAYPSYYDEKGLHRIHSKEFKEQEKKFKYYEMTQNWIGNHTEYLFHTI